MEERRRFCRELALVLTFVAAVFTAYFVYPEAGFHMAVYGFILLYAIQLIRHIRLFTANYRLFCRRMDNYFSDCEAGRLRWVIFSFCAALTVGVLTPLSALFMSDLGALLFSVALACFYTFFAIRFLNYAFRFHFIETAVEDRVSVIQYQQIP
jgi:hypothetical protein